MIAYIKGVVKFKEDEFLILENNGIGYKIFAPAAVLFKLKDGTFAEFYIYHQQREDGVNLYGFARYAELKLFEQLISVSGVGPKTALAVFSGAGMEDIVSAIVNGDAAVLKKVSGIGPKTAERIVLELRNKVSTTVPLGELRNKDELGANADALAGLLSLGYSEAEAREALRNVSSDISDPGARLKAGLKNLKQ